MPEPVSDTDTQIAALANSMILDGQRIGDIGEPDPEAPEVAIPSVLQLGRRREQRLAEFVERRYRDCERESGRAEVLAASESGDPLSASSGLPEDMYGASDFHRGFMAKRRLYELCYNLKVEWRKWAYPGLFTKYNYPVPMSRRLIQQQIARAQNYFFATDPWFTAGPEGDGDEEIAKEVDRFAKYKSRKGRVKASLCEAIRQAFIRGEGILKTSYERLEDLYETVASVAVYNGRLYLDAQNDYIFESDGWKAQMIEQPVIDPATGAEVLDPATGQPAVEMVDTGQMVLMRDGVTPRPQGLLFEQRKVRRSISLRRGAQLDLVHFLDFLCPLTAPDVQSADFVAHVYEKPALHIAQQVLASNTPDRKAQVIKVLRDLTGATTQAATGQMQHRPEVGENHAQGDTAGSIETAVEPRVKVAECYVRFDVDGDGVEESLFVLYNIEDKSLIYYDYLANVTPDGKRPFHIVRANPVDNRWYGLGQMELFEDQQNCVDLFFNRVVFANSSQATVIGWHPERCKEGEANTNLKYNHGMTITPIAPWKLEDVIETKVIYEPKIPDMMKVIEFTQQNTLNLSGVTGANDADAAGLDTQKTATGVRNIDRTGQELFGPFLQALEEGLTGGTQAWIGQELFNLDGTEVYEYFEGDTRMTAELDKDRVRNIAIDLRMELTRYRNEQQDVQMMQATELIDKFYALPVELQHIEAPMYRHLLKGREIPDADRLIQPGMVNPMLMGMQQPGGPGPTMQGTAQPPSAANPVTPVGADMPGASQPLT